MRRITLSQLVEKLETHAGAVIISMTTRTEPRLLAKSRRTREPTEERYSQGVEKLCRGLFMLANRYRDNVRSQRRREGHASPNGFRSDKLWAGKGERLGRFLARHKETGKLYVVARPASDEHGYPVRIWQRWIDLATGRDIAGEELLELRRDWLADRPAENHKQQLARRIPYRTYQVLSIHSVTFAGETYKVEFDRQPWVLEVGS